MTRRLIVAVLLALGAAAGAGADVGTGIAEVAFVSIRSGDPQIYTRDSVGQLHVVTQGKGLPGQPAWASNNRLAFAARVDGGPRIFITDENGLSPQRLTADDRMEMSPSWSPDGQALAYYSRSQDGAATELRVVDVATRKSTVVARDERDMGPTPPSWSADGSRLVFSALYDGEHAHVWVVQRDGSRLRNLTAKYSPRGAAWPNLSPDGRTVLWIADMRERMPIIATDVESGESRDLTPAKDATNESPRWSSDGLRIVFASARDSFDSRRNDIFVMDADGTNVRNVTRHPGEDFDPKWSADGRSVVFASLRSGTSLLYEVNLVNGSTKPVSEHASHDMDHVIRPINVAKRAS